MSEWWFSRGDGKTEGPLSAQALVQDLVAGKIPKQAHVCRVGEQEWVRVSQIDEIWEAANPEQINTNTTERPWFLSVPESGQHPLADADAEDERTHILTPLPIVTANGGINPFVTPLPHLATHRELFARQAAAPAKATPLAHVPTPHVEVRDPATAGSDPMRARVPTLDGISESSPPEVDPLPVLDQHAYPPDALAAIAPRIPKRQVRSSPLSPVESPSPAVAHGEGSAPSPLGSTQSSVPPSLGLESFAVAPPRPTMPGVSPHVRGSGPIAGISSLQGAPPPTGRGVSGSRTGNVVPPHAVPAPSLTRPRPLNLGGLPPAQTRPLSPPRGVPAAPIAQQHANPPNAARPGTLLRTPAVQSEPPDAETLELIEDDELTTIAQKTLLSSRPPDTASDDEELTTIAQKALLPSVPPNSIADNGVGTMSALRKHLSPSSARVATDDDEQTAIVSAANLPRGKRPAVASRTTPTRAKGPDGQSTTMSRDPVALRAPHRVEEDSSSVVTPTNSGDRAGRPVAGARSATTEVAVTPLVGPLVSDPSELMEEVDDEPPALEPPLALPAAARPSASPRPAAGAPASRVLASPPSAPPRARRPRLGAPSIVLKPEPIAHQEETQPAARALRRPGSVHMSHGTLIVVFLGIALVALAAVYFFLKR